MTLAEALRWTQILVAWATVIDGLERLVLFRHLQAGGIWDLALLSRDYAVFSRPVQAVLNVALAPGVYRWLLFLQLALAVLLAITGFGPLAVPLLGLAILGDVRFRGSFNGGSDAMIVVLWTGLVLAASLPTTFGGEAIGLGYLAVQAALSYFIAGVVKAKVPGWWRGTELTRATRLPTYDVAPWARRLFARRLIAAGASLSMLALELLVPLAFLDRHLAWAWVMGLGLFHGINAVVFGLNRFFWTWIATYPAILWATSVIAPG